MSDPNGVWQVVDCVRPIEFNDDKTFIRLFGQTNNGLVQILEYLEKNDYYLYNSLSEKSKLFAITLFNMIQKYDLDYTEFYSPEQFGFLNDKLYCIDFGLNKTIQEMYYDN